MAKYYVQNATVDHDVSKFYGNEAHHNHDDEVAFSRAVRREMEARHSPHALIELSKIRRGQSRKPTGRNVVELRWKDNDWTSER